ncbi:hypothetical protein Belba_0876 [Belliella baltica DSM 15883]|uniref:Uncharacterized protein n=1 Tax=Belliella baltica (strain DSM 15883 / CIP 108006 / LMG 21964 / BA134) TaxID=866536 RepID=I3Z2Q5_BELBD|nr:hypothetical protein [Belliella baltica]AFL83523.1 hypothetical protein Belba_0876 [Belliella baltica DSM 15883]
MILEIKEIADVKIFFEQLLEEESLNFHPDEDFKNYINVKTRLPSYSSKEANLRNCLLESCFELCQSENVDIYEFGVTKLFSKLN